MGLFNKGLDENESVIIKAKFSILRKLLVILAIIIPIGTFIYSYNWSSRFNENVWDGIAYSYFNPFIGGVAISLVLFAIHIVYCRCKLVVTNKKVYGKASIVGKISIPIGAINKIYAKGKKVCIVVKGKTYKFIFVTNAKDVVENVKKQIAESDFKDDISFKEPKNSNIKTIILVLVGLALAIVLYICAEQGVLSPSRDKDGWDSLSEEEKDWYRENGDTINELQDWVDEND